MEYLTTHTVLRNDITLTMHRNNEADDDPNGDNAHNGDHNDDNGDHDGDNGDDNDDNGDHDGDNGDNGDHILYTEAPEHDIVNTGREYQQCQMETHDNGDHDDTVNTPEVNDDEVGATFELE
eukprot:4828489-Heterocapsa_arctica.AAC.1